MSESHLKTSPKAKSKSPGSWIVTTLSHFFFIIIIFFFWKYFIEYDSFSSLGCVTELPRGGGFTLTLFSQIIDTLFICGRNIYGWWYFVVFKVQQPFVQQQSVAQPVQQQAVSSYLQPSQPPPQVVQAVQQGTSTTLLKSGFPPYLEKLEFCHFLFQA